MDCGPPPGSESQADVSPSLMSGRDVAGVSWPLAENDSWNIAAAPGPRNPGRGRAEVRSGLPHSLPLPSTPSITVHLPQQGRPLDENCLGMNGRLHRTQDYGTLTYDKLHQLRRSRGCAKKDTKAVIKTRLPPMCALERHRARGAQRNGSGGAGQRVSDEVCRPSLSAIPTSSAPLRGPWGHVSISGGRAFSPVLYCGSSAVVNAKKHTSIPSTPSRVMASDIPAQFLDASNGGSPVSSMETAASQLSSPKGISASRASHYRFFA